MDLTGAPRGALAAVAGLALPLVRRTGAAVRWATFFLEEISLEWRDGRIGESPALWRELLRALRPLDILLERGPLRATDAFIPGYFKHAAVVLCRPGTAPDAPGAILEARRNGVRRSPVPPPGDLDSVAVLRDLSLTSDRRSALLARAAREVGKSYDYRFDRTDEIRQFCSKLVAQLFSHLPLGDGAGADGLVLPDDLARLALRTPPPLRLSALVVNGQAVVARSARPELRRLLGGAAS